MKNINAIPTRYNGHLFRSRLEARWAVFFDELRIEWMYEVEGYSFKGYKYLPDFYLPRFNFFCEVKPVYVKEKKHILFSKYKKTELVILEGLPIFKGPSDHHIVFSNGEEVCPALMMNKNGKPEAYLWYSEYPEEDYYNNV